MARNARHLACPPSDVFAVLADGWLYPSWVVGAARMREVSDEWPLPGGRLHHSFGVWPFLINDTTHVEHTEPGRRLVMVARGWPMGAARVDVRLEPVETGTTVTIVETPISGPAAWLRALVEPLLLWRNHETLHRLAYLAENGADGRPTS